MLCCSVKVYDAGDFSLLCSESSRCGERWVGGEFVSVDRIVVWSNEGRSYLYKLPTKCVPSVSVCLLFCQMGLHENLFVCMHRVAGTIKFRVTACLENAEKFVNLTVRGKCQDDVGEK